MTTNSILSQLTGAASALSPQLTTAVSPTLLPSATTTTSTANNATTSTAQSMQTLAGNFDTFLQLLTTQLQNQDPLDPLDTDQFTQQIVEFASVEQQVNMNSNLQTMISLQQTSVATSALQFLGDTVTINGNAAALSNANGIPATWSLTTSSPATANVTITSSTGQTAYTGTVSLNAGTQSYTWNGKGNNGVTWPDGNYTISISATGANGQPVTVSTQVTGVVTGINLSQNPPTLTVGGQNVAINQIVSITR